MILSTQCGFGEEIRLQGMLEEAYIMEVLVQNQQILITIFKVVAALFCFFLIVILIFYNWLYLSRILKANDHIGLRPPRHIHHLVRTSIFIPVFAALFIIFFILFEVY